MSLVPENSYLGKCSCGTEFMAPKGTIHCSNCLYSKIAELEKTKTFLQEDLNALTAKQKH